MSNLSTNPAVTYRHRLIVVLDDCHLKVKSCELAQVTICVRILGTKNRSDLINSKSRKSYAQIKIYMKDK